MNNFAKIIFTFTFSISVLTSLAQDYRITINNFDKSKVDKISELVSIDKITENQIIAYANEREFSDFKKLGIPYLLENLSDKNLAKANNATLQVAETVDDMKDFDLYPSYEVYVQMMEDFYLQHPDITELIEIGESVEGRKILALKISDADDESDNPEFFLTSTIHGDEICGYVLMLRLIDYILTNYETDEQITDIVRNIVLYINPLSNPDATYYGGNSDVSKSRRYNVNGIDLNRNFPKIGKTTSSYEPEVQAMMDFADNHHFVMSANLHAGDEVLNYPWDSFYENEYSLPDKDWFVENLRHYVSVARQFDSDYMITVDTSGYVFGSDWYKVIGGRQDYMLYYKRCREITIELSEAKQLSTSELDFYWQKNYKSILDYLQVCRQGLKGYVTDIYGNPLEAEIVIKDYDANHSSVFSYENGKFFRPLLADKSFEVCAYLDGYQTNCQTVTTEQNTLVNVDFVLEQGAGDYPVTTEIVDNKFNFQSYVSGNELVVSASKEIDGIKIVNSLGQTILTDCPKENYVEYSIDNFSNGIYVIKAQIGNIVQTNKIMILR